MTTPDAVVALWSPASDARDKSQLGRFWRRAESQTGRIFNDYASLHSWSVEDRSAFWGGYAEFSEIDFDCLPGRVKGPDKMPGTEWFPGARLNYAKNMVQCRDNHLALIARTEEGETARVSYSELYAQVESCAGAMRAAGVSEGDRIASIISNGVEAVVAFLAGASIGAIWSSCSPDFGAGAAVDRLGQIEPKLLIASAGYTYAGTQYDCVDTVEVVAASLPTLTHVVLIGARPASRSAYGPAWLSWGEFVDGEGASLLSFASLPFDHPLYILFSSGTTGVPKCMVHGAGGSLIQHRKEHQLHTDITSEDVLLCLTTTGWMMWNWLVSALAARCTLVLYDGNPTKPSPDTLWKLVEELNITMLSTSAAFIEECMRADLQVRSYPSLRVVIPTGSPVSPSAFRWIQKLTGPHVRISSMSGGTDIVSCFVLGNPLLPVYAGEIQCLGLGMDVAALDSEGEPVMGAKGELVCRRPFPSMPISFWNDPDDAAYRSAYFETYPDMWHHGDFVEITERGGVIIYGRSDSTLNPRGVRIGTAEIYRPLEKLTWVADALAAGLPIGASEEIVLFVVVADPLGLSASREAQLREVVRTGASPRHVPRRIVEVPEVPRTRNGKLAEIAVGCILRGEDVANIDSLRNPSCLRAFLAARGRLMA